MLTQPTDARERILQRLNAQGAVMTGSHFGYTSGNHGRAYINMREVAHEAAFLADVGREVGELLLAYDLDGLIGPETLGRNLAGYAAQRLPSDVAIWCFMSEDVEGNKVASFFDPSDPEPDDSKKKDKMKFARLVDGGRWGIVDDLGTTGGSARTVAKLIRKHGGIPVVVAFAVRRTPDIGPEQCGVENLEVFIDVEGFEVFTPEECADHGPCSEGVPMNVTVGHGKKWSLEPANLDFPTYPPRAT
jgi:orotate phosphoribosyltransferase